MMSSLGESGFPVFQAGHWDWQRPHSVQVVKSSQPFQEKSSMFPAPRVSVSGSTFSIVRTLPLAIMGRSEEHTSELQSLMRISYAVFCLTKKNNHLIHSFPHKT